MATVAITLFVLTSIAIVLLFALKWFEVRNNVEFGTRMRRNADVYALRIKALLIALGQWAEHLPSHVAFVGRSFLHAAAVGIAHLARAAERSAYRIADMLSHRHGFHRRQTESKFLRQVGEREEQLDNEK